MLVCTIAGHVPWCVTPVLYHHWPSGWISKKCIPGMSFLKRIFSQGSLWFSSYVTFWPIGISTERGRFRDCSRSAGKGHKKTPDKAFGNTATRETLDSVGYYLHSSCLGHLCHSLVSGHLTIILLAYCGQTSHRKKSNARAPCICRTNHVSSYCHIPWLNLIVV